MVESSQGLVLAQVAGDFTAAEIVWVMNLDGCAGRSVTLKECGHACLVFRASLAPCLMVQNHDAHCSSTLEMFQPFKSFKQFKPFESFRRIGIGVARSRVNIGRRGLRASSPLCSAIVLPVA